MNYNEQQPLSAIRIRDSLKFPALFRPVHGSHIHVPSRHASGSSHQRGHESFGRIHEKHKSLHIEDGIICPGSSTNAGIALSKVASYAFRHVSVLTIGFIFKGK